jgi:hypothetical protein
VSKTRRRAITTPGERVDPARRGPATVFVSIALHIVAIAVLVRVAIVPLGWIRLDAAAEKPVETHVNYVRSAADTASKQRAGGDNRRANNSAAPAPLVSPSAVPSSLPPEPVKPATPAAPADGGLGPVIGGGGPTRGVTPAFTDPRLWAPSEPLAVKPKTPTQRLDSVISSGIRHFQDSIEALGPQRAEGDWSWKGKDGKKYGVDQKYIHLGNFSIPTALLALLPLNIQGNPTTYGDARRINAYRGEILEQAARSARDEDFNAAVKELRERKTKERADKVKENQTIPEAPPVRVVP